MIDQEISKNIRELKEFLGDEVVILAHHYQRDEVYIHGDFTGDSLKLAQLAISQSNAKYIIFCGVHFMAETAAILSGGRQKVILPNLEAGCPMADKAPINEVLESFSHLKDYFRDKKIVPITYINSTADVKAFVGKENGYVCTSSNADKVLEKALERGDIVFFLPDQHLGRNTSYKMGIPLNEMAMWDRKKGLIFSGKKDRLKVILWGGHCWVHQMFQPTHVIHFRKMDNPYKIIVHPECSFEVFKMADYYGSTEKIIKTVEEAESGTFWAIGTEKNLVMRLARNNPDKNIEILSNFNTVCRTMSKIRDVDLLNVLKGLKEDVVYNEIVVSEEVRKYSKIALQNMFLV